MFKKILIANRGEIAVRIARACREMGIPSVAVYSDADQKSLHVQKADEAYPLGSSSPRESYLNIPKILAVAQKAKADAIHPGYGFLSENYLFAETCEQKEIVFIGPPPSVIRQIGDKIEAKKILSKAGIPIIPGDPSPVFDLGEAKERAARIGYPVLLKAAAGGGGKGMREVRREEDLADALEACRREAQGAFGDDRIFLEKFIENPRHVEIQVLADHHGNTMHLFERECSIQRRHQKIIEETPSPALDEELREAMGETAVRIAKLIGYRNAGTVEFILDANRNFYFLEVNARLQVEHPITEMVTGVDLVKGQIEIAAGEALTPTLSRIRERVDAEGSRVRAHAIECRIYAEDPENNFLPSPGKITELKEPAGEGIRLDSGIYQGWEIPYEYDPLLAKLIVHAPSRAHAIRRMIEALAIYRIQGIRTNILFLIDLLRHPEFIAGRTETGFIEKYFRDWAPRPLVGEDLFNPWMPETLTPGPSPAGGRGESRKRHIEHAVEHDLTSPMPGRVVRVLVQKGDTVTKGQILVIVEAMKMENSISAPHDGTVVEVFRKVGESVGMGEKLVELWA